MNITVFSGDNVAERDGAYLVARKEFEEVLFYEAPLEAKALEIKLFSSGFFESKKVHVFKNIFLHHLNRGKLSETMEEVFKLLVKAAETENIYFVEDDSNKIKYYKQFFPRGKFLDFKHSAYLFSFLDSFKGDSLKTCFAYYEKAKTTNPTELLFFMLKKRVRELLLLSENNLTGNYQSWQIGKLKGQLASWDLKKLKTVYKALFKIEEGLKTGKSPLKVEDSLEIVLGVYL